MNGIIYEVKNTVNGHRYIGLTRFTPQKRWKEHCRAALKRPKTHLHFAISKYGAENFEVTEIAYSLSVDLLGELERFIIIQEKPEYNQTCGGEVTLGRKYTDEVKETIRRKNIGRRHSEESKRAISEIKKRQYKEIPDLAFKSSQHLRENRHKWESKRIEAVKKSSSGRSMPEEHKERLRGISKSRVRSKEEKEKIATSKTKKVKCETDGRVYTSRHEAALEYKLSEKTIWRACNKKCGPVKGLKFYYIGKES